MFMWPDYSGKPQRISRRWKHEYWSRPGKFPFQRKVRLKVVRGRAVTEGRLIRHRLMCRILIRVDLTVFFSTGKSGTRSVHQSRLVNIWIILDGQFVVKHPHNSKIHDRFFFSPGLQVVANKFLWQLSELYSPLCELSSQSKTKGHHKKEGNSRL